MGYWGVKSYENDDADDALDAGFERVHGDLYEQLMDDGNPLSFEQVQKGLADSRTLWTRRCTRSRPCSPGCPRRIFR